MQLHASQIYKKLYYHLNQILVNDSVMKRKYPSAG
jgi:hypothetical protein